ncbi:prepilin-type N-terminal cleavage/methylation domain-containing protein [Marinobacter sp. G11]|uniref:PilW family protein n=1 Tax=Marinobacter sp. G11 TaxID=2903522 RepID=UPI001E615EC7|nr:prepilin-type N-terminal cleavage/methylation domain-containing protein [Marinobacter sp. G11]MCE0758775.1 prepilin-type N-terminal cleavage/methylation domain-containing protein [Marinobacter sp. G11]
MLNKQPVNFCTSLSLVRQKGLTLIELMVGLIVGLIVIGGVMTVYLAVISSSGTTLKSSKLNLEMGAVMSVMTNDIRRAGIWNRNFADEGVSLEDNPFSEVSSSPNAKDGTALEVHDSMADDNNQVETVNLADNPDDIYRPNGSGSCIVYAYDSEEDDSVDNSDLFGFRLNNGAVEMREEGDTSGDINSCTNGTWAAMNDTNVVTITELTFDLQPGSTCLVSNEPNEHDEDGNGTLDNPEELDCYQTSPNESLGGTNDEFYVTAETRVVTITMVGELVDDEEVRASLTQRVRVRNDLVRSFE